MRRLLPLSVIAGLALGAAGASSAQSRTVSTADMPKPGVSYISGPSTPERRETVSTGTLPQPARLYVNGQPNGGYPNQGGGSNGNGNYGDQTANDGGGYYSGGYGNYPGNNDAYGHSHDHDHGGYPGNGNYPGNGHGGHDGNGYQPPGNAVTVGVKPNPNPPSGKPGVQLAAPRQDHDANHNGGNGWNTYPQPIPNTGGLNTPRASQPGTGMGTGNQPGTGIPLRGGGNGYGRGR
jgi:hypothetical protein